MGVLCRTAHTTLKARTEVQPLSTMYAIAKSTEGLSEPDGESWIQQTRADVMHGDEPLSSTRQASRQMPAALFCVRV